MPGFTTRHQLCRQLLAATMRAGNFLRYARGAHCANVDERWPETFQPVTPAPTKAARVISGLIDKTYVSALLQANLLPHSANIVA